MKPIFKVAIAFIVALFISYTPAKKKFEDTDFKTKFKAYSTDKTSSIFNRLFRTIPNKLINRYQVLTIKSDSERTLFRVDDMIYGVLNYSYLVFTY